MNRLDETYRVMVVGALFAMAAHVVGNLAVNMRLRDPQITDNPSASARTVQEPAAAYRQATLAVVEIGSPDITSSVNSLQSRAIPHSRATQSRSPPQRLVETSAV